MMTANSKLAVISKLRPYLLLLVIINHCTPGNYLTTINGGGKWLVFNGLQVIFGHILTPAATGLFFLISGFLYFNNVDIFNIETYKYKTRKRLHSLIIPYLVWNIIAMSFTFFVQIYNSYKHGTTFDFDIFEQFWCCYRWADGSQNIFGISMPMYGPADLPLWYLRDLIVVSLIAPLVFWFVSHAKSIYLTILGILFVSQIWTSIPGFSIDALLFFSIGVYMAIYREGQFILLKSKPINSLIAFITVLFIVISSYKYPQSVEELHYIQQITTLLLVISFIFIANNIFDNDRINIPTVVDKSSFFVYAIHAIPIIGSPLYINSQLIGRIHFQNEALACMAYLASPFVVYAISILFYVTCNRFIKHLMPFLTGNR